MRNKLRKKGLVLGITGSYCCGKTTVAGMFARLGASCINVDAIYRRFIKPRGLLYERIVSAFGRDVLGNNKQIDRKKLAKIVFGENEALKRLCRITHPAIIKRMNAELSRLKRVKRCAVIIIDAPLLIEAGLLDLVDKSIAVKAGERNQIARCKRQRGASGAEVIKRIRSQAPQAEKIKLADYVINNNGTLKQTREQVKDIWRKVRG
ncbi:MAG: dephospho-CoA kinase [Candidatus Omnitrophica bacterium]|nr:dephospho-CoA kinase [Candidatus Omnitrophota bacterium]